MREEGQLEPMKKPEFLLIFQNLKIKDSDETIEELAKAFKNSKRKIDVVLMLKKYLRLYPDTKL